MVTEEKKVRIFWPVFFAVWLALSAFGACAGYIVSQSVYTIEGRIAGECSVREMNLFGAVLKQGPCE